VMMFDRVVSLKARHFVNEEEYLCLVSVILSLSIKWLILDSIFFRQIPLYQLKILLKLIIETLLFQVYWALLVSTMARTKNSLN